MCAAVSRCSRSLREADSPRPIPQTGHAQLLRHPFEFRGRAPPPEVIHRADRHVRPERGELAKQDRQLEVLLQRGGEARRAADRYFPLRVARRDFFEVRVAAQDRTGGLLAPPRDAGETVRGVADQGEVVGNRCGADAKARDDALFVAQLALATVELHDPLALHALAQVLVWGADDYLLHGLRVRGHARSGRERIVGLELLHRPTSWRSSIRSRTRCARWASSSGWNCAMRSGSIPALVL